MHMIRIYNSFIRLAIKYNISDHLSFQNKVRFFKCSTPFNDTFSASLELMGAFKFIDYEENRSFLMNTQTLYGGFGKFVGSLPDVMHSYMGLAGLSLMDEPDIRKMDVALNVSLKGVEHLKNRTLFWKDK